MEGRTESMKVPPVSQEEPLQGIAQVRHQVEPIDDLDRLGRPLPNPLSIEATAIAADDLDTGVRLQPLCDRGGRAHREPIKHVMVLEITHEGPKAPASPPGPVVAPYDSWGRKRWQGCAMDETHNRPVTPREAQLMREPHTGTAAYGEAHVPEGCADAPAVAATDRHKGGKLLGENTPQTGGLPAEEATDVQMQEDRGPRDGPVGDRAPVRAMHRGGAVPTAWTYRGTPPGPEVEMPDAMNPIVRQEVKRGKAGDKLL
jgi:hypothetical protein